MSVMWITESRTEKGDTVNIDWGKTPGPPDVWGINNLSPCKHISIDCTVLLT